MNFRGNDSETDKAKFVCEFTKLWQDMLEKVYLKKVSLVTTELVVFAWDNTKYSPLQLVSEWGNPSNITNQIERGQKAREKRWKKWHKENNHEV